MIQNMRPIFFDKVKVHCNLRFDFGPKQTSRTTVRIQEVPGLWPRSLTDYAFILIHERQNSNEIRRFAEGFPLIHISTILCGQRGKIRLQTALRTDFPELSTKCSQKVENYKHCVFVDKSVDNHAFLLKTGENTDIFINKRGFCDQNIRNFEKFARNGRTKKAVKRRKNAVDKSFVHNFGFP